MQITIDENYLNEICQRAARLAVQEYCTTNPSGEIMSKQELGEYLKWSPSKIERKMREGMPFIGRKGERPRYRKSDIDKWTSSNL
jgi:hypothetical protein